MRNPRNKESGRGICLFLHSSLPGFLRDLPFPAPKFAQICEIRVSGSIFQAGSSNFHSASSNFQGASSNFQNGSSIFQNKQAFFRNGRTFF